MVDTIGRFPKSSKMRTRHSRKGYRMYHYRGIEIDPSYGMYSIGIDFDSYDFETLDEAKAFIDRAIEDGVIESSEDYQVIKFKRWFLVGTKDLRWNRWYFVSKIHRDGTYELHGSETWARKFSWETAQKLADSLNRKGSRA